MVTSRIDGSTTVLEVHGVLTAAGSGAALRRATKAAMDTGSQTVVINLRDVVTVDSSGVSDLASCHTTLAGRGCHLKICHLSHKLKDVFVVTRLNTVFDIYETEADAMADSSSVGKNPS
jgi:anti-sigma B factor antagonist